MQNSARHCLYFYRLPRASGSVAAANIIVRTSCADWQITHLHTDAQNALQPTTLRALLSLQWPASAQLARFRLPPQLPSATF